MLWPIRFSVDFNWTPLNIHTNLTTCILNSNLHKIQLVPYLLKHNYCVHWGVAVNPRNFMILCNPLGLLASYQPSSWRTIQCWMCTIGLHNKFTATIHTWTVSSIHNLSVSHVMVTTDLLSIHQVTAMLNRDPQNNTVKVEVHIFQFYIRSISAYFIKYRHIKDKTYSYMVVVPKYRLS
jgi:hypothetical protein